MAFWSWPILEKNLYEHVKKIVNNKDNNIPLILPIYINIKWICIKIELKFLYT